MKVIARNDKWEWFTGELDLEKMKISKKKKINKLAEVKTEAFVTIKRFIKITGLKTSEEVFFKTFKIASLYLLPETEKEDVGTEVESEASAEKKWWKKFNNFCLGCSKECKQSSKVIIVKCPSYEKMPL